MLKSDLAKNYFFLNSAFT